MIPVMASGQPPQTISPKTEYARTLLQLADALLKKQNNSSSDPDHGGIVCPFGNIYHTRAAEAVYPFAVAYRISRHNKYLQASIHAGNWLIRQQQADGSWKETPEEWTGTTTDQLLMLLLAYPYLDSSLTPAEKARWRPAMRKAATYLQQVMSPEFASINYVATTSATLALAGIFFGDGSYTGKARSLARSTVAKMDEDGFINGEGGRSHRNKSGVDLGYDLEMSLWGLGYYARLLNDSVVDQAVRNAVKNHLYFIYPDGSMDASWGIRSNKWTTYGSATSDGCMALFSMYADEDPAYATAAVLNLRYLQTNMHNGIVGYGPQHTEIFGREMCNYPTFTKAKNIAFAWELEQRSSRPLAVLPTQVPGWMKYFNTLDVVEVRTKHLMATVTGYNYKDYSGRSGSKYMHRPAGGAISNLWVEGYGLLQASSQTSYSRPEPMSFPEATGLLPLTPRIEYTDSTGYFTNLYNFDCRLSAASLPGGLYEVTVKGEMCDKEWLAGGVAYRIAYTFGDSSVRKSLQLTYHDARPVIRIVEPFIHYPSAVFRQTDAHTVIITSKNRRFRFSVLSGDAQLVLGEQAGSYQWPYPALKAFPVTMVVSPPAGGWSGMVSYSLSIID